MKSQVPVLVGTAANPGVWGEGSETEAELVSRVVLEV